MRHTGPIAVCPPDPTPIVALERRAQWELAALLVALVAVPGFAAGLVGPSAPPAAARDNRPAASKRTTQGRHVRPPRSC
ncbi:MAG TPA: hypothetical protein VGO92_15120 [Acidimicrobiales bacterium]|nr:hypothetical protein [Acidimicrobiales bacterium]